MEYFESGGGAVAKLNWVRKSGPPPVDTTVPTVALTTPVDGATVTGLVTLQATASDNVGVSRVEFRVGPNSLGPADTSAPYSASWNTAALENGSYTLTAVRTMRLEQHHFNPRCRSGQHALLILRQRPTDFWADFTTTLLTISWSRGRCRHHLDWAGGSPILSCLLIFFGVCRLFAFERRLDFTATATGVRLYSTMSW